MAEAAISHCGNGSARLAAFEHLHEFLEVRLKIGEQRILPVFQHDLAEQFQADGERCCRFRPKLAAARR
jgi:hypothetical protein